MAELNFKKLADAPILEEVPDGAKVYAQDDGAQTVMANGDSKITLKSPLGKLYIITVSDDGTLTTTEVTT